MSESFINILNLFITKDVLVGLETALGLIFLDVLLGILQSLTKGDFDPRKLPKFLQSSILPYLGSLILMAVFSALLPEVKVLFFTAVAAIDTKFLFDVKDKVTGLVGSNSGRN